VARFQMQIATTHPILFLSDDVPKPTVPDVDGRTFASASDNCLYFGVLSDVDGASLVTISDQDCTMGGTKLFSGSIQASTGVLTLTDSGAFRYLNIPVPTGPVFVEVWADDDRNPEWVWVKLDAIRAYP
jgi:hypothetical protein